METLTYRIAPTPAPPTPIELPLWQAVYAWKDLPNPCFQLEFYRNGSAYPFTVADLAYPDHQVAVYCDSAEYHFDVDRLRHDAERRNWLQSHGWKVLVFWGKDLVKRPEWCGEQIAACIKPQEASLLAELPEETALTEEEWKAMEERFPQTRSALAFFGAVAGMTLTKARAYLLEIGAQSVCDLLVFNPEDGADPKRREVCRRIMDSDGTDIQKALRCLTEACHLQLDGAWRILAIHGAYAISEGSTAFQRSEQLRDEEAVAPADVPPLTLSEEEWEELAECYPGVGSALAFLQEHGRLPRPTAQAHLMEVGCAIAWFDFCVELRAGFWDESAEWIRELLAAGGTAVEKGLRMLQHGGRFSRPSALGYAAQVATRKIEARQRAVADACASQTAQAEPALPDEVVTVESVPEGAPVKSQAKKSGKKARRR